MKNTRKILALVLVLMMVLPMFTMFTASAAAPEKLYLTPNANWKKDNARFAARFWNDANQEKWVNMTDTDKDGVYECAPPAGYPYVIFCRMDPAKTANNWNNKWNQSADLTIPTTGANHYVVAEGTWDKGGGTWKTLGSTCQHTNLGEAATCTTPQLCLDCKEEVVSKLGHAYNADHLCTRCNEQATFTVAGSGAHLGVEWTPGHAANDMTYADGVYTKVYTNVAAGTYLAKVARDHDWGTSYPGQDKSYTVATAGSTVTFTLKGTTLDIKVEAPHTHNFVAGEIVAPTFDAEGYTTYTCSCGGSEKRDIVPALVAVAQVGDVKYADIQEAIKAAAPAGTVELLCDVTVEEWIMISEILTIGDGTVITLDMNGLTIDGNGHTLTINNVESAGNGNHIFYDGDYNVCDLTLVMGESVNGLGITSGTISNVTFIGGRGASAGAAIHVSDGIVTGVHAGNVTIEGCTFKNNGAAIYFETAQDNLVVNNNTFEIAAGANVIMFRGTERFTNNTVVSGRTVNVVSGSPVITGNDFGDVRLKVYNEAAATITNNTINNLVFNDESATKTVFGGNTLSEAAAAALAAVEHEEPAHEHAWSDATCTEGQKCECGETQGEALGHDFVEGVCSRCEAADPDYAPEQPPVEEPAPQGIFDMILAWIMSFIEMILGWFKF